MNTPQPHWLTPWRLELLALGGGRLATLKGETCWTWRARGTTARERLWLLLLSLRAP